MIRITRADRARGIPMAMLFGLQAPHPLPDKARYVMQPDSSANIDLKQDRTIAPETLLRIAKALAKHSPCEAIALAVTLNLSRTHTSMALAMLEQDGLATRRRLKGQKIVWLAVEDDNAGDERTAEAARSADVAGPLD